MRDMQTLIGWLVRGAVAFASLLAVTVQAAAPGITGPSFALTAAPGFITQPDGDSVYTWGFGCTAAPAGSRFVPAAIAGASCPAGRMQLPGPTLIVTQGETVMVTLTNNLPAAAGNTSILFPGFDVTATGAPGLLTSEAVKDGTAATYTFVANKPGTYTYYSGTQGDLQVEMGLYGALIVLPNVIPANCVGTLNDAARANNFGNGVEADFRLAAAAFNHAAACYDREYLFQFSTMDPRIHRQAQDQAALPCSRPTGCMVVETEPYAPTYFMINGRSFPDLLDPNYSAPYPHQPYNGNPQMHPGELVLLRIVGNGRWQHPFHEHGNHVRLLARDGNMLLTPANAQCTAGLTPYACCSGAGIGTCTGKLAGPLLFTTTTTPGMTMDGIFQWTGKGLNWDVYAHTPEHPSATAPCTPDANGYHNVPTDPNYYEWCGDHNKPLESKPFGQVGSGGPVTLPDANIMAAGAWYGGSAYLGPDATGRASGSTPIPPSGTVANDPGSQAAYAYMWHSHNEREITTNNAFPGGMLMMMLVNPRVFVINEAN